MRLRSRYTPRTKTASIVAQAKTFTLSRPLLKVAEILLAEFFIPAICLYGLQEKVQPVQKIEITASYGNRICFGGERLENRVSRFPVLGVVHADRQLVVDKGVGPARDDLQYTCGLILEPVHLGFWKQLRRGDIAGRAEFYRQDSARSIQLADFGNIRGPFVADESTQAGYEVRLGERDRSSARRRPGHPGNNH